MHTVSTDKKFHFNAGTDNDKLTAAIVGVDGGGFRSGAQAWVHPGAPHPSVAVDVRAASAYTSMGPTHHLTPANESTRSIFNAYLSLPEVSSLAWRFHPRRPLPWLHGGYFFLNPSTSAVTVENKKKIKITKTPPSHLNPHQSLVIMRTTFCC